MAAHLYPGVKSLQLVLDKPYDTIRTTDVRDDLASVKVWYSTTSGFNPNRGEGTLVPSGNSLTVTIPNLLPNTRYYVKYAFISAIDIDEPDPDGTGSLGPGSYTVSQELDQVVYDENVTVYGYLTNDPTPIVTTSTGTGGNFTNATGVFKLFNLSQEVTGGVNLPANTGPVYGIKPLTTDSLTGVTIDSVTGVYSCTGLTDDGGNVTFTATYNNITVEQVWNVYKAKAGETAPLIQLTATLKEFVYKDSAATTSQTATSTITARVANIYGAVTFVAQAYRRNGTTLGDPYTWPAQTISAPQTTTSLVVTSAAFDTIGVEVGYVKVTATIGNISDVLTLYRINDGTDQITVEFSNDAHVIPAYQDGTTDTSSYVGSGTVIQVKQGNTYLQVDNVSPYAAGTWTIDPVGVGIIANGIVPGSATVPINGNSIVFNDHASMDNNLDVATIDYIITGKTTSGVPFSITKRQSFAKSKEGLKGATARNVSITAPGQAFITAKNTTTTTQPTITLTAVQSNFIAPQYTWELKSGDQWISASSVGTIPGLNPNTFILNSFAPVSSKTLRVTVSEVYESESFSVFDIFTIYSLREGDDAFIAGLSNENQTISYDSGGSPIADQFPVRSQFYAVVGNKLLNGTTTPQATFAPISYTGGNSASYSIDADGLIRIESLSNLVEFAEAKFSATVNGTTIIKSLTLNKSKDGKIGEGTTQVYVRSASQPSTPAASAGIPSGWYETISETTGTNPLWTSFGKRTVGSTIYTWQTPVRVEGVKGDTAPPLKNATGYLYYSDQQESPPGSLTLTYPTNTYNFTTGTFSNLPNTWSTTFNVPSSATSKMWAIRYSVQETLAGATQVFDISAPFTHQNFNGLVTFTNNTYQTSTQVDNAITGKGYQTSTQVDNAITGKGYQTSTQVNSAINSATSGLASVAYVSTGTFANTVSTNMTSIDGAKITTGSVTAEKMQIGKLNPDGTGNYIRMFDNKIVVYSSNNPRVIIGNLG